MDSSECSLSWLVAVVSPELLAAVVSGPTAVVGSELSLFSDSLADPLLVGARAGSAVALIVLASSVVVVKRAAVLFRSVTPPSSVGQ